MRLPGALQRVAAAVERAQPAGRVQVEQLLHRRAQAAGQRRACTSQKPMTAREVAISRPGCDRGRRHPRGHPEGDQPAERGQRAQRRVEHPAAGHLEDDVDRPAVVGLEQGVAQVGRVAGGRTRGRARRRRRGRGPGRASPAEDAVAMTRRAPISRASCTARQPTPPAAACTTTVSPGAIRRAGAQQVPRRGALQHQGQRGGVVDRVGQRERRRRVGERLLGVPAVGEQRDDPAPVRVAADHLGARDERELLRRQVVVGRLVGVGVVDAGRADVEQQQRAARLGRGQVDELEDLGAPEPLHLDGAHRADSNALFPADYCRAARARRPVGVPGGRPIASRP